MAVTIETHSVCDSLLTETLLKAHIERTARVEQHLAPRQETPSVLVAAPNSPPSPVAVFQLPEVTRPYMVRSNSAKDSTKIILIVHRASSTVDTRTAISDRSGVPVGSVRED